MKATVSDIKRFAVHDGDGIRTTVFLKGCPLRCLWCHNPEGLERPPELAFYAHKCVHCGACASVCASHTVVDGVHSFDRAACVACGRCAEVCPANALQLYGREMTVEEVFAVVEKDRAFYEQTGGGVTLSGGECLLYPDFCAALLSKSKAAGIGTAVDTCGFVERSSLEAVLPYTDLFLYDLKAYDEGTHIALTGQSNARILDNLRFLSERGAPVELRIPVVPSYNEQELPAIADFLRTLKNIKKVRLLAYHDYARSKYLALGKTDTLPKIPLPTAQWLADLQKRYFSV